MKHATFLVLLLLLSTPTFAQTIEELLEKDDYEALADYADKTKNLSPRELYCVGYGLYRMDRDAEAVKLYDQAIEAGLDSAYVYRQRGRAHTYLKDYTLARADFRVAIEKLPESQLNHTEMGISYLLDQQPDSALIYLRRARDLPFVSIRAYTFIPRIYAEQGELKKAREEYAVGAALLDANSPAFLEYLSEIGRQAYTLSKDFPHSVDVYLNLLHRAPEQYQYHSRAIKALNANQEWERADSLFAILQEANERGELPEDYTRYGRVGVDEFQWNEKWVVVYRYLELPTEMLEPIYLAFLFSEDGEDIERILLTEKTFQLSENGSKHLFCEQMDNGHATYPMGWETDEIPYPQFKLAVYDALDGKLSPSARSYFQKGDEDKKKRRKKKKKRKNRDKKS